MRLNLRTREWEVRRARTVITPESVERGLLGPVFLGGESTHTLKRVVEFCEGWFPRGRAADRVLTGLAELRELSARAGRDPKTIAVSVFGAAPDAALLDRLRQAGVDRAILRLPSEGRDRVLPLLDQWASLVPR